MARITVPEADELLDVEMPVLDKGFVRLVDYMGGDARVVQSARVSYGSGTKTVREDKGLINYLVKNAHTSPLEQVVLTFHIKLPIFVFAQQVRHRTARVNAMSARYSVMKDEFYIPAPDDVRIQSNLNKQATTDSADQELALGTITMLEDSAADAYRDYLAMMDSGVAREQARMILPQNLYTEVYWQIDLHNLFHFLRLRLDWHAQKEIRVYAEAMAKAAKAVAPWCYEAFEEYILYAQRFSRKELVALRRLVEGGFNHGVAVEELTEREREEFIKKLWG